MPLHLPPVLALEGITDKGGTGTKAARSGWNKHGVVIEQQQVRVEGSQSPKGPGGRDKVTCASPEPTQECTFPLEAATALSGFSSLSLFKFLELDICQKSLGFRKQTKKVFGS